MKKYILITTASILLGTPILAQNYINVTNPTGSDGITSLSITQDNFKASNVISSDGSAVPGTSTALPVSGMWNTINIGQFGGNSSFYGSVKTLATSTTANLTATFGAQTGSSGTGNDGYNVDSLTIGNSAAPLNPYIQIVVANTNGTPSAGNENKITDIFNVSGGNTLNYTLNVSGDTNLITNTVSGGGTTRVGETVTASSGNTLTSALTAGGTLSYALNINSGNSNSVSNMVNATSFINVSQTLAGSSNSVTDKVGMNAAVGSYYETIQVSGSGNTITNTVAGAAGADMVGISLGSSGNTVSNTIFGTGTQTANLMETGNSKIDYSLAAGSSGKPISSSSSYLILNNVIGAGAGQAAVNVTQSGNGATLIATVNGLNGATVGAGGLNFTQASANAYANVTVNGFGSGYSINLKQ
jgi:hypothetical protein